MFKKSLLVVVFVLFAQNLFADDAATLDDAARAALQQLADVNKQELQAKVDLTKAKAEQAKAKGEFDAAEKDNKDAVKKFDVAQEEFSLLVTASPSAPSVLQKAQDEFEAAANAVRAASAITATHPKDTALTERLAKAQGEWDKVSKKVGELRARIKRENAARFEAPTIATPEEILTKILEEQLQTALEKKTQTATALAEKQSAKSKADDAVKTVEEVLKALQAERDRIRSTEELRKGLNGISAKIDTGSKALVKIDGRLFDLKTSVDTGTKELAKIDGRLTDLKDSVDALTKVTNERSAQLLLKVAGIGVRSDEEANKISQILNLLTAHAESSKDNSEALAALEGKLANLTKLLEQKGSPDGMLVQFYDKCTNRWYAVSKVSVKS